MMMRKTIFAALMMMAGLMDGGLKAQGQADTQMKQAKECLERKEYVKARSLFLNAYGSFAAHAQYEKATQCGVSTAALYHRENLYKEAFDMLRATDQLIASGEQQSQKARPDLHYATAKERMRMYTRLKHGERAEEQLARMGQLAKASGTDSLQQDLLYTQAGHYYTFGQAAKGDAAISQLTDQYKKSKQYTKMLDCYHKLIDMGKHSNNATLTSRAYEQLILWQDSIRTLKAQDETAALKKECADKQAVINEKESSLKGHKATIYALCGVAGILGIVLVVGGLVMVRFIVLTRKQKKVINALREHSELKDKFILGISAQTAPTLEQLDQSHPATKALKEFFSHIEALTHQESLLTEPCEMEEKRIDTFCEHLTSQIREKMDKEVTLVVNAPKLSMKMNSEMLEHVLLHLLTNAYIHTPEGGKVTLEYKKRGAHSHQFVVSDTGSGIEEAQRPNLFKPFTKVRDLTKGDGLGLPICALMATRMNGSLKMDEAYTKGTRFLLDLHA